MPLLPPQIRNHRGAACWYCARQQASMYVVMMIASIRKDIDMTNIYKKEQKRQQDTLRRINQQLEPLEERITALLSNIDLESMTTNQRVQASYRLQTLMRRLLELREECALLDEDYREQALRNLALYVEDREEN